MPFSETTFGEDDQKRTITKQQWNHIFSTWIKKAVESYRPTRYDCKRSPAIPGNFVKGIISDLGNAELVIADLTGGKPNVYYELGIRHTLRTGTIITTQHLSALPSDLAGYYAFDYTYSEKDYEYDSLYSKFEQELHSKILALEKTENPSDSPVSDFLGLRHELLMRSAKEECSTLRWLLTNIKGDLIRNCEICEDLCALVKANSRKQANRVNLRHGTMYVDLYHTELLYGRLLTTGWSALPFKEMQGLLGIIGRIREGILLFQKLWEQIQNGNVGGKEMASALFPICQAITAQKKAFQANWDGLVDSLAEVKLVKTTRRNTPQTNKKQKSKAKG